MSFLSGLWDPRPAIQNAASVRQLPPSVHGDSTALTVNGRIGGVNLAAILDGAAAKTPDKPVTVAAGYAWTYREVVAASHRGAARLLELGVAAGDRVAIMAYNTPEFIVAMVAIWRIGAVLVPVNHKLSASEVGYIAAHSGAVLLLASPELHAIAAAGCPAMQVVALDGPSGPFTPVVGNHESPVATVARNADDPAQILYTSGTTGKPKGCVHTHGTVRNTAMTSALTCSMVPSDRTLIAMPIWHAAPLNNFLMATLFVGGTLVLMREYAPSAFVRTLQDERVSVFFGAPVSFALPLSLPGGLDGYDFSAVRALLYGGGPISADLARGLAAAYRTDRFFQVYGMTEMGPGGTVLYPEEQVAHAGSIGRMAQPGVDMRVVSADGAEVQAGEVGEIWLRSPSMMQGYLGDPAATAEAIVDGWYRSGDLARVDADGYLFIVDRLKDMIVTGGENVYSKEVEDALHATGLVADCAVVGVPHPEWGETVVAALIAHPGTPLDPDALTVALRTRLAAYKVPRRLVAVDALPRNPTGKVLKAELRDLLANPA
jgi:feruloyl-CoA synthase